MALTGNAAILAAHGKARASGWKGAKPLRVTGAWAGTTETTGTTGRCLKVLRAQEGLAGFARANGGQHLPRANGMVRKRTPCHLPVVSVVPAVSARPPSNEIPCGRPVHCKRQFPLAGGPPTGSGIPCGRHAHWKRHSPNSPKPRFPLETGRGMGYTRFHLARKGGMTEVAPRGMVAACCDR